MEVQCGKDAFLKMLLHAYKYPYCQIGGILVGNEQKGCLEIQNCYPIYHGPLISTIIESALNQIEEICKDTNSYIVGAYFANENYDDNTLHSYATRIGDKICDKTTLKGCTILILNNANMVPNLKQPPVDVYQREGGGIWKSGTRLQLDDPKTLSLLQSCFDSSLHLNLCDFDNHLDDLTKDWTNSNLFTKMRFQNQ